jgi:predicted TIM-barrel fold metal-dependent hydrolase
VDGIEMLFEVTDVDRKFYEAHLEDFLPKRIIDVHTHVWLEKIQSKTTDTSDRTVTWPERVARKNSIEDLMETYQLMFPGKTVTPMIFPGLPSPKDVTASNAYVRQCAADHNLPSLVWSIPQWDSGALERKIIEGQFLGAKCYLTFADPSIPAGDICIFDYFPHHQLEVLNARGWIVMLHIPRPDRLKDPVNLTQMIEIEKRYPNIKLIVAHVGRTYCTENVGSAFEVLAETQNMVFDISANTNAEVLEQLIRTVGPKRVLFGSDLPITRMRMRRICRNGTYVNLVPKDLYGNVSGDKNMREVEGKEARRLTFFMYEEIAAFHHAAQATGLAPRDIEDIFHNNAKRIIESARSGVPDSRTR